MSDSLVCPNVFSDGSDGFYLNVDNNDDEDEDELLFNSSGSSNLEFKY